MGLKRQKGKAGSKTVSSKRIKSIASANGQGDRATPSGGVKENLIPAMKLAGLISAATKSKKKSNNEPWQTRRNLKWMSSTSADTEGLMTTSPRERTWHE